MRSQLTNNNSVYAGSLIQEDRHHHQYRSKSSSKSESSSSSTTVTTTSFNNNNNNNNNVCDRTVVRVRRSGYHHERIRVVCTTRRQHVSRLLTTISDNNKICQSLPSLPPFRKHVTVVSFPPLMERSQVSNNNSLMMGGAAAGGGCSIDHLQERTYFQAPNFAHNQLHHHHNHHQTQTHYGTPEPIPLFCRDSPTSTTNHGFITTSSSSSSSSVIQPLHKKGSLRNNGDILKRSRVQTTYELSQDILDKQIEVLERKYGGVKARNAALIIQRAFRRYTLLKKFAAITAMAKAEKRISRRLPLSNQQQEIENNKDGAATTTTEQQQQRSSEYIRGTFDGNDYNNIRMLPVVRSMSLRERQRNIDNNINMMPIPRSQSGTPTTGYWGNYSSSSSSLQHYYSPSADLHQSESELLNHVSSSSSSAVAAAAAAAAAGGGGGGGSPSPISSCSSTPTNLSNGYVRATSRSSLCNNNNSNYRKVPPEVPKRTSSITSRSIEQNLRHNNSKSSNGGGGLSKTAENGSLSSVQSSESDSSISTERIQCEFSGGSPIWKRKSGGSGGGPQGGSGDYAEPSLETSLGNISNASSSTYTLVERAAEPTPSHHHHHHHHHQIIQGGHHQGGGGGGTQSYKISETIRKRQYRVGLNLFNKKPEKGITYLMRKGFLENSPQNVARFLISRKGLSKQMIGEYLGNLQNPFCMDVLERFAAELDLSGMQVDVALRKFQQHYRMPGEAQKIERLMEVFSQRYCQCNLDVVTRLRSLDTIFVLSFAIIMLNTDLHTPNIKPEKRMKVEDFIKNLRGIDDCGDIDSDMLTGIYERVKANEFKPGSDHVTQVMKVQATIVGKKPNMALPHRRLVCYCRLYEIPDINKKERPGVHQREVFMFNDLLAITKILSKKKSSVTYTFRTSYPLCGMVVTLFQVPHYPYGIKLSQKVDQKVLVTFNARNEHDRCKFAEDLKEAVSEMEEMENLRIEAELERQKSNRGGNRSGTENRDSGVADVEVYPCHQCPCSQNNQTLGGQSLENNCNDLINNPSSSSSSSGHHDVNNMQVVKRSALSNSLLDIHEQFAGDKAQRRGSVGSLDSGMSVSFQSTSSRLDKLTGGGGGKQPNNNNNNKPGGLMHYHHNAGFLGSLFNKRHTTTTSATSTASASGSNNLAPKSTEV